MTYDAARQEVLLFGGHFSDTRLWRFGGGAWSVAAPAASGPGATYGAAMAYDAARQVTVLFGGGFSPSNEMWEWDGTAWTMVTPTGPVPPPRAEHGLVYDAARARTVLFGGYDDFANLATDTWVWDGMSWTEVTATETAPIGVDGPIVYDVARQETVLIDSDETWVWDGATWTQVAGGPGFSVMRSVYDSNRDRVLVFGTSGGGLRVAEWDGNTLVDLGQTSPAPTWNGTSIAYDAARGLTVLTTFDGETWTWNGTAFAEVTPAGTNPPGRRSPALAYDPLRQRVVMHGGQSMTDTWEWDGAAWTQIVTTNNPPSGSMTFDHAQQRLLLFAGGILVSQNMNGRLRDVQTWAFDGTEWTEVSVTGRNPRPRTVRSIAFDRVRSRVVVHGGVDPHENDPIDDTWEIALPTDPLVQLAALLPANVPPASLADARIRGACGGRFAGSGLASDGAALYVRTGTTATDLATNTTASPAAGALQFAPSISQAAAFAQSVVGAGGVARFGCRSNLTGATGGDGEVAVDYLEVRWRY